MRAISCRFDSGSGYPFKSEVRSAKSEITRTLHFALRTADLRLHTWLVFFCFFRHFIEYICPGMQSNTGNINSGIIFKILMIFFFTFFINGEKREKDNSLSSFDIYSVNILNQQAILGATPITPGISFTCIHVNSGKYPFIDCTAYNNPIVDQKKFTRFSSCELKLLFKKPIISLSFLLKIPSQEKGDDPLPLI